MKYTLTDGKIINIPEAEIESIEKGLQVSKLEAMQIWLEDNEYQINEEQEKLDKTAKSAKIGKDTERKPRKKSEKPKNVKVSDAKKNLFSYIVAAIMQYCAENAGNCTILKENKLIEVKIGETILKIDIIEARKPKT